MHLFFVLWMNACLLSAGILFGSAPIQNAERPYVFCPERKVQMGVLNRHSSISARYALINKGNQSLEILDIKTSCSCSPAIWDHKAAIAPGDTLWVELKFSPKGYPPGPFTQSASVISNARNSPYLLIMEGHLK